MLKKITNWINRILYAIPFGMKAANEEILVSKNSLANNDSGIHQVINQNKVAHDLLRGEVTQQIEELRYRTYLIEHESKKYRYLGDGIAIKENNSEEWGLSNNNDSIFDFIQRNDEIIGSVENELNRIGKYGKREFTLKLKSVNYANKYRNEEYIQSVTASNKSGELILSFKYTVYPNKYDPISRMLINDLEMALNGKYRTNDSVCDFECLSFVTMKAIGEEDYKKYSFYHLKLMQISKNLDEGCYEVKYYAESYDLSYLLDKYYNKRMDEKYKNKEAKEKRENISDNEKFKIKCEGCGKLISDFDAEESKKVCGKIFCIDCLKKNNI